MQKTIWCGTNGDVEGFKGEERRRMGLSDIGDKITECKSNVFRGHYIVQFAKMKEYMKRQEGCMMGVYTEQEDKVSVNKVFKLELQRK